MSKSKERLYAEHCYEQNLERMADHLRELLAESPGFFKAMNRILNMDNMDAVEAISLLSPDDKDEFLGQMVPLARIGLSIGTFKMEDKYR